MHFKTILLITFFMAGCSFRTMNIEQGNLIVVSKESVATYNLRDAGWIWDAHFITDELLKITVLSDRDLFQYSLGSGPTINAAAYFCSKKEVNYPIYIDLYIEGKNFQFWNDEHVNDRGKPNTPMINQNGKSWYSYEVLAVSKFSQDRETPDSEPEAGKVELYGKYNLRAAPADLCIVLTGYSGGFSNEKSNVLVIKKEDIKRAFENYK